MTSKKSDKILILYLFMMIYQCKPAGYMMDEKQIQLMLKYPKLPHHSIPTSVLMDGWIGFGPLDLVLGLGLNLKFRPI